MAINKKLGYSRAGSRKSATSLRSVDSSIRRRVAENQSARWADVEVLADFRTVFAAVGSDLGEVVLKTSECAEGYADGLAGVVHDFELADDAAGAEAAKLDRTLDTLSAVVAPPVPKTAPAAGADNGGALTADEIEKRMLGHNPS